MTETRGRLVRDDGEEVAWLSSPGVGPTLVWLGGARSDMTGAKASALAAWARSAGRGLMRFDYYGHGGSTGVFAEGSIGRWRADALAVIDGLTEGPLVLVGSSMGGWIAILAALARCERVAGLVLVAPAPDYTVDLVEASMSEAERTELQRSGAFTDAEGEVYTRAFLEDGRRWCVLGASTPIAAPVRILQGAQDPVVPWRHALRLAEAIEHSDVVFTLVRDGDHRLSRPADVARLIALVAQTCGEVGR